MKYLLDAAIAKNGIRISIITLAELYYGAYKSQKREAALLVIETFLEVLSVEAVQLNKQILLMYGELKATLEAKGSKLDEFELLIGATAKHNNLILVTGNKKHFKRIPELKLYRNALYT